MDTSYLTALLRSLAATPSRRGLARALVGSALAGLPVSLFRPSELVAKKNKKKKRRHRKKRRKKNQPFCAGKNVCTDGRDAAICGDWQLGSCYCIATTTGTSFCGYFTADGGGCELCADGETCVDPCTGAPGCALPCPNPL